MIKIPVLEESAANRLVRVRSESSISHVFIVQVVEHGLFIKLDFCSSQIEFETEKKSLLCIQELF